MTLRRLSIDRDAPGNSGHYSGTFQPIDATESLDLRFTEGSILKYICRHRKKNGRQDVEKVIWYLRVLWSRFRAGELNGYLSEEQFKDLAGFCDVQGLGEHEREIVSDVACLILAGTELAKEERSRAFEDAISHAEALLREYDAATEKVQAVQKVVDELEEVGDDEMKRKTLEDWIYEIKPSPEGAPHPTRFHMEDERLGKTVVFQIGTERGYFTVNWYNDGNPGEVFVRLGKEGSESRGFADCWAIGVSMLLQYGVDPRKIYDKFSNQRFEPEGMTGNLSVPIAKSIVDLVMRWMERNLPPTAEPNKPKADEYDAMVETVGGK
jgi:hypothetical protein